MEQLGITEFTEEIKERYGKDAETVLRDALNLDYSLEDMIRIICIHLKHTSDPFVNEEAFVADGHNLGLQTIINGLQSIWAEVEKSNR